MERAGYEGARDLHGKRRTARNRPILRWRIQRNTWREHHKDLLCQVRKRPPCCDRPDLEQGLDQSECAVAGKPKLCYPKPTCRWYRVALRRYQVRESRCSELRHRHQRICGERCSWCKRERSGSLESVDLELYK